MIAVRKVLLAAVAAWSSAGLLTTPGALAAQTVSTGVLVQSLRPTDTAAVRLHSVDLRAVPFAVSTPVAGPLTIGVAGALADAALVLPNGSEATAFGLTDLRVQARLTGRSAMLTLTGWAPTGEIVKTLEDAALVGALSADLLPFAVSSWGQGGALSADLDLRHREGDALLHLGGGFMMRSEFDPLSAVGYRPGPELRARAGVDVYVGRSSVFSIVVAMQRFQADQMDDADVFTPGNRLEGMAAWSLALGGRESVTVSAGARSRGSGVTDSGFGGLLDSQALFPGAGIQPGRTLLFGEAGARVDRSRWVARPTVGLRVLRSGDGMHQGWLASAGGGGDVRLTGGRGGRRLLLVPQATVSYGRLVVASDAASPVVAVQLGVGLRWEGGR